MTFRSSLAAAATLSLSALAITSAAQAQEIDWSGFYIGANAGAAWGDTSTRLNASRPNATSPIPAADIAAINAIAGDSHNKTGFTGGIEAGYNYQAGSWLFGIETDYNGFDINQHTTRTFNAAPASPTQTPAPTFTLDQRLTTDWIWTLRPRIGYVSGPWLFYATAGLASTKIKYEARYADNRLPPNTASVVMKDAKTDWTAGLGAAYAFSDNWSAKAEWLYADFGHFRGSAASGAIELTSNASVKANLLRVGIDYRF